MKIEIIKKIINQKEEMNYFFNQPMDLKNITFKTEKYVILKDLSISFKENEYIGILGSSGAGKTTLLNLASGRVKQSDIKLYGGQIILKRGISIKEINSVNLDFIKTMTGYVHQHDILPPLISINEYMNFVVDLANNNKRKENRDQAFPIIENTNEKEVLIKNILKSLNLDGNKKIENLSGGERKRTSIGLELLYAILTSNNTTEEDMKENTEKNNILFLDEPTTGLDNGTALTVMQLLKTIEGIRICTIHQPIPRILNLFDRIIILNDGRIFFNGTPKELKEGLQNVGINCTEDIVDIVFIDVLPKIKWNNGKWIYQEKELYFSNEKEKSINSSPILKENKIFIEKRKKFFFKEISILIGRLFCTFKNKPFILISRTVQSFIIAMILAPIFYNLKAPVLSSLNQQITGFYYQCTLNIFYSAGMSAINLIYQDYDLFKREYQHNYYSITTYYFTKVFEGIILYSFLPIISPPLIILATKIPLTISRFFIFCLINWLISMCGFAFAIFFSSIFKDQQYALISLTLTLLPLDTISGLLIDPDELIFVFKIVQYFSPTRYAFNGHVKNHFYGSKDEEIDRKRTIDPENATLLKLKERFVSISTSILALIFLFFLLIFMGLLIFNRRVKRD